MAVVEVGNNGTQGAKLYGLSGEVNLEAVTEHCQEIVAVHGHAPANHPWQPVQYKSYSVIDIQPSTVRTLQTASVQYVLPPSR